MPSNRLAGEKSPYLLQHAENPVDWFPWGDEAFEKARREDKPVFLSVGYSTCHWCHVMERESFENVAIAELLNREFVSIKVDREERPDVDRLYMLFVQATTGSGGWPMSVWLTPDRKPFFGGTYFPPDSRYGRPGFSYVLEQLTAAWKSRRAELRESSDQIVHELETHARVEAGSARADQAAIDSAFSYFRRTFDAQYGGFGDAPKFPRPAVLHFLFRYYHVTGNDEAVRMALFTLRAMAKGGMHDQLGGGFHRYSVDDRWFVPHFEKMLYDQAQLATSYLEAFQLTREQEYAKTARDIFRYVLRDLRHTGGAFFSAEDADSAPDAAHPHEKREGAFYVWRKDEIVELLGTDAAEEFCRRCGVKEGGNVDADPHGEFTGQNILYAAENEASHEDAERLLAARSLRPRPHLDDKILAGWNGLMISALAQGSRVLDAQELQEAAAQAARFLLERMYEPGKGGLLRRWREDEAAIGGFLDDYASLANALVDLYETSFETHWLEVARALALQMMERFEDAEHGGFFSTGAGAGDLLVRMKEDYDGAEPSGNSLAATVLLRLEGYMPDQGFGAAAERAFEAFASRINQQGPAVPYLMGAFLQSREPQRQVVLVGEDPQEFLKVLRAQFRPFDTLIVLRSGDDRERFGKWVPLTTEMKAVEGRATAYVCENYRCQAPLTDPSALG